MFLNEATIQLRGGSPDEITLTVKSGVVTDIIERGKVVPVTDKALHRLRSLHAKSAAMAGGKERKLWNSIKWPPRYSDIRPGQPFAYGGTNYVKLFSKGARTSEMLDVAAGKVVNKGFDEYTPVARVKAVTLRGS
jgi:hypothetical protein